MNNEKFFYEVAVENHKFLKAPYPLSFHSTKPKDRRIAWLLYSGFMETWMIITR